MALFRNRRAAGILAACLFLALASVLAGACVSARTRTGDGKVAPISAAEEAMALEAWRASSLAPKPRWPDAPGLIPFTGVQSASDAGNTPLAGVAEPPLVNARSAIVIDATTGSVLFEKDADEPIPPASMTKLVAMYATFRAMETGSVSFDDVVTPPSESWAVNIPPGSSLMFLGEGQRVTVRELLEGMATVSGNDAAIALAYRVAGSVDAFVGLMNSEVRRLGLSGTSFAEPSGLSERNMTTSREFADFSRAYVGEYPEALKAFHSLKSFSYPMEWNLPAGSAERPIFQRATNRMLGSLPGCDGLKTGFINESGYNMTLTAMRDGTRFISVTMGGPGNGSAEGNELRCEDGANLMEWAFANFRTMKPAPAGRLQIAVFGGTSRAINAIPATAESFTALKGTVDAGTVDETTALDPWLEAPVQAGDVIGAARYSVGGKVLREVPLVADRNVPAGSVPRRAFDAIALLFARDTAK
jgi:serine-type D-Ala-D-Ala carboxypeptidase (penicillin-binding protein 5/6)